MTAFEKLLVDLSRDDVAYMLVGGLAVTLNGADFGHSPTTRTPVLRPGLTAGSYR